MVMVYGMHQSAVAIRRFLSQQQIKGHEQVGVVIN